MLVTKY